MPVNLIARRSPLGLPSDFVRKGLLLLRSGYVRELAAASYPHIHCGGRSHRQTSGRSTGCHCGQGQARCRRFRPRRFPPISRDPPRPRNRRPRTVPYGLPDPCRDVIWVREGPPKKREFSVGHGSLVWRLRVKNLPPTVDPQGATSERGPP